MSFILYNESYIDTTLNQSIISIKKRITNMNNFVDVCHLILNHLKSIHNFDDSDIVIITESNNRFSVYKYENKNWIMNSKRLIFDFLLLYENTTIPNELYLNISDDQELEYNSCIQNVQENSYVLLSNNRSLLDITIDDEETTMKKTENIKSKIDIDINPKHNQEFNQDLIEQKLFETFNDNLVESNRNILESVLNDTMSIKKSIANPNKSAFINDLNYYLDKNNSIKQVSDNLESIPYMLNFNNESNNDLSFAVKNAFNNELNNDLSFVVNNTFNDKSNNDLSFAVKNALNNESNNDLNFAIKNNDSNNDLSFAIKNDSHTNYSYDSDNDSDNDSNNDDSNEDSQNESDYTSYFPWSTDIVMSYINELKQKYNQFDYPVL